jgi:hypothetical protein
MRSWALLLVVATSACNGAPTLDVAVHHPAGFAVDQTVVTVYFGGDIDCTKIEFGDRTEAELAAIQVDEVDASHGGSVEVSRLGGKSIVARGFDDQRRFVTAGCQDLGEIAGSVEITIDTQPTAVVAIDPSQPDRPFSERTILVTMTDIHGTPIDGLVSWQLSGPAGAIEPVPAAGVATTAGNAVIKVDDLGTPGPEGLRIRVPWATAPLPLVTAFDLSHATTIPLGTGAFGGHPSCDVRGHAGKPPTLICLAPATDLQLHRDAIEIAWQTDHFTATPIPITAGGNNQFALFVDHDGSVDEPVYVISASPIGGAGSWYKLGAGSATPVAFGDGLESVVYAPRCKDNSTTALVGVGTSGLPSKVQFFTPAGTSISTPQAGEVFSGGCVADVDGHEHQAVVVAGLAGDAGLVLVSGNGSGQTAIAGAKLTGSGFVVAEDRGAIEKRFAGTRLQASGTVVFEAVLAPEASTFKLVERSEVDAAAPPTKIISGKLDQDGDTDLMWDMPVGLRRRLFQVSLAKQVSGVPLSAMTSGPVAASALLDSDFLVGDLDGQGVDEMVVFTQGAATIYSADQ